jgi:lactoylglutathione lyase
MINGLDHLHFLCGDVEKSVKFFEDVFGGKVESRGELRGFPMIRMEVKGVFVNIMGTDPKAAMLEVGKGSRGLDHFGFRVKGLEKMVEELKKRGAKISSGPGVTPAGVKFAFIDGPEGIRIELVER